MNDLCPVCSRRVLRYRHWVRSRLAQSAGLYAHAHALWCMCVQHVPLCVLELERAYVIVCVRAYVRHAVVVGKP